MIKTVSVIIPTFGGDGLLNRALESALTQDYEALEIVVVDDNGRGTPQQQRTQRLVERYLHDSRVRYMIHETNRNGAAARNTGMRNSSGDYLCFLDDDDALLEGYVRCHVNAMEQLDDRYAMTYCSHETYLDGKLIETIRAQRSGDILFELLTHRINIESTALMMRRDAFEKLGGFDESFRRHQDWEFTARIAAEYKVGAVDHMGFRRYLTFRNDPKDVEQAMEYRRHYLQKMQPVISDYSERKKQSVRLTNEISVILRLLSQKRFGRFAKAYRAIDGGGFKHLHLMRAMVGYVKLKMRWKLTTMIQQMQRG